MENKNTQSITDDNANQNIDAATVDTTAKNETSSGNEGGEATTKTYTEAEVQLLLQQETDRRVTSALKKQEAKWQKEKAEADKLRDMDAAQRKEYEYEKKVEELEAREREFALTQNKLSASKVMAERGLPINFVDYIVAEDAETMMNNITEFEKAWKAAISDAVSAKLASPAPKTASSSQTGLSKEEFAKMSISQQSELYRTNPELYKQMTAR